MSDEAKKPERDLPPGVPRADDGTKEAIRQAETQQEQASTGDLRSVSLNPAQQAFVSHCQALLETVLWGTITKFQGFNANVVAIGMCRAMGMIVGTMFHGSLTDILMVRRQCKDAFLAGLTASPSPHLLQQHQQPGLGDVPYAPGPGYRQKVNGK